MHFSQLGARFTIYHRMEQPHKACTANNSETIYAAYSWVKLCHWLICHNGSPDHTVLPKRLLKLGSRTKLIKQ